MRAIRPSIFVLGGVLFLISGCGNDSDGDGYSSHFDCDDHDASVNPGAVEVWYDDVDQNCDGNLGDQDGDGDPIADFGGADCDDTDETVSSLHSEIWYDGIDQDCDGRSDYDRDGDGFDAEEHGGSDCDDESAEVIPGRLWYSQSSVYCDRPSIVFFQPQEGAIDFVWTPGDLDGDGVPDLMAASSETNGGAGKAWLFQNDGELSDRAMDDADAQFEGTDTEGGLSFQSPQSNGDLNGDAYYDLVWLAPTYDGQNRGAIHVLWGGENIAKESLDQPNVSIVLKNNGGPLASMAFVGDVDKDGMNEMLIGGPSGDSEFNDQAGIVYLIYGSDIAELESEDDISNLYTVAYVGSADYSRVGGVVAGLGDLTGDGVPEMGITSEGESETIISTTYIFEGDPETTGITYVTNSDAALWFDGKPGPLVPLRGGDLNGDGYQDLVVTSAANISAVIFYGGELPTSGIYDEVDDDGIRIDNDGEAISAIALGDVNSDGVDDLLLGAPYADGDDNEWDQEGAAYLFLGDGSDDANFDKADLALAGHADDARNGAQLAEVDWNQDGFPDLLIASPGDDTYAVQLYLGGF